jgi:glycerophosphoryl diester phosphodiesterase
LRALDEGATAIELDVRASSDGEVVVFHDPDLRRIAGRSERVCDLPARDILGLPLPGGHAIPRLTEVLDALRGRAVVNVEIKADLPRRRRLVRAAVEVIRASGCEVVISSFHPGIVALCRATSGVEVAQLFPERLTLPWRAGLAAAAPRLVTAVHLADAAVDRVLVQRLIARGLRVALWTVNDPARAVELLSWGAAWIITDEPLALSRALVARR